jgi:hypothetical protein
VFLGDSMFERMTTTGETPNFVAPWPSPAMLSDEMLRFGGTDYKRIDRVFNAGVRGDKIQNLVYRLVGASHPEEEEKNLPGLLPMLAACGTVKLWVIHIGTNNLHPKHGLRDDDVEALRKLVEALLNLNSSEGRPCHVAVTLLWPRKDISRHLVYVLVRTVVTGTVIDTVVGTVVCTVTDTVVGTVIQVDTESVVRKETVARNPRLAGGRHRAQGGYGAGHFCLFRR